MGRLFDYYALLVGRILIGGYFLWNGVLYALNLPQTAKAFISAHIGGIDPTWLAIAVIALMAVGGIAIIVDWKMRYFALALALYLIAATAVFHSALQDPSATNYFLKNMALIGALLYVSATSG